LARLGAIYVLTGHHGAGSCRRWIVWGRAPKPAVTSAATRP